MPNAGHYLLGSFKDDLSLQSRKTAGNKVAIRLGRQPGKQAVRQVAGSHPASPQSWERVKDSFSLLILFGPEDRGRDWLLQGQLPAFLISHTQFIPRNTSLFPTHRLSLSILFCKGLFQGENQSSHTHHLNPNWPWGAGLGRLGWQHSRPFPRLLPGLGADIWLMCYTASFSQSVQNWSSPEGWHQNKRCMAHINSLHIIQLHKVTRELILKITKKIWLDPLQGLEKTS